MNAVRCTANRVSVNRFATTGDALQVQLLCVLENDAYKQFGFCIRNLFNREPEDILNIVLPLQPLTEPPADHAWV